MHKNQYYCDKSQRMNHKDKEYLESFTLWQAFFKEGKKEQIRAMYDPQNT